MKNSSDDLYQLICALSASEKRYFNQYAKRHTIGKVNNYYELYQIISRQEVYDEIAARQAISLKKGHFAVVKRQLYEQLLDSLQQYHREMNSQEKCKRILQSSYLLLEKGLILQAEKRWKKASKLIKEEGLYALYTEMLLQERALIEKKINRPSSSKAIDAWEKKWKDMQAKLKQIGIAAQRSLAVAHQHYRKVRLQEEEADVAYLVQDKILTDILEEGPASARLDVLRALSTYHFMQGASQKAFHYNEALLKLFEANAYLQPLYPQRYMMALNNFLIDNFQLQNWQAVEEGLATLRKLPSQKAFKRLKGLEHRIFEQSSLLEINMLVTRKAYQEASHFSLRQIKALQKLQGNLSYPNRLSLLYLMALSHLLASRPEDAIDCINAFLELHQKNTLEELHRFGRLLQLLIHFELENYELLPYLIQSVRRSNQDFHPQSTSLMLSSLQQLLNAAGKKSRMAIFQNWKTTIADAGLEKKEGRFYEYLDIAYWLNQKIAGV